MKQLAPHCTVHSLISHNSFLTEKNEKGQEISQGSSLAKFEP